MIGSTLGVLAGSIAILSLKQKTGQANRKDRILFEANFVCMPLALDFPDFKNTEKLKKYVKAYYQVSYAIFHSKPIDLERRYRDIFDELSENISDLDEKKYFNIVLERVFRAYLRRFQHPEASVSEYFNFPPSNVLLDKIDIVEDYDANGTEIFRFTVSGSISATSCLNHLSNRYILDNIGYCIQSAMTRVSNLGTLFNEVLQVSALNVNVDSVNTDFVEDRWIVDLLKEGNSMSLRRF